MQQKINAIFTKRVLELNGSLGFNDSLSSCNRTDTGLTSGYVISNMWPSISFNFWDIFIDNYFMDNSWALCILCNGVLEQSQVAPNVCFWIGVMDLGIRVDSWIGTLEGGLGLEQKTCFRQSHLIL